MGAATRTKILLQQSAELRAQASSRLRTGAARPLCATHERSVESGISLRDQISGTNAARSSFAEISKCRPALRWRSGDGAVSVGRSARRADRRRRRGGPTIARSKIGWDEIAPGQKSECEDDLPGLAIHGCNSGWWWAGSSFPGFFF